jgi:alpha-L-fucosidase
MKKLAFITLAILLGLYFNMPAQSVTDPYKVRMDRTEWFRDARFGMFIHWGLYAIPARGEWVRNKEQLTLKDYQTYFEEFNPVKYNPESWAKLAKNAGMKYVVITAKHHDGFCLFDSKLTDYKVTNTPYGKDLLTDFVEAFRKEGLRVGFYYSLIDWHHPDYPNVGNHPMAENPEWDKKKYDFDNYLEYMHGQVKELLTNYGKIDIMWFDYSFGEYSGEKWKATKLVKMVRELQPDILIDNRLGGNMESTEPELFAGDFEGPEQVVPSRGVFSDDGKPLPWELCVTLNNNWGYSANDDEFKSPMHVIRTLVNCVSKGGNMLLNVGPNAYGEIPDESKEILMQVGHWMEKNGESIYNCGRADFPKPQWGRYTQDGNKLYAHVFEQPIGQLSLEGLKGKIKKARLLRDGTEVFIDGFWLGERSFVADDEVFLNFGKPIQHTYLLPDLKDTVIELVLEE